MFYGVEKIESYKSSETRVAEFSRLSDIESIESIEAIDQSTSRSKAAMITGRHVPFSKQAIVHLDCNLQTVCQHPIACNDCNSATGFAGSQLVRDPRLVYPCGHFMIIVLLLFLLFLLSFS